MENEELSPIQMDHVHDHVLDPLKVNPDQVQDHDRAHVQDHDQVREKVHDQDQDHRQDQTVAQESHVHVLVHENHDRDHDLARGKVHVLARDHVHVLDQDTRDLNQDRDRYHDQDRDRGKVDRDRVQEKVVVHDRDQARGKVMAQDHDQVQEKVDHVQDLVREKVDHVRDLVQERVDHVQGQQPLKVVHAHVLAHRNPFFSYMKIFFLYISNNTKIKLSYNCVFTVKKKEFIRFIAT